MNYDRLIYVSHSGYWTTPFYLNNAKKEEEISTAEAIIYAINSCIFQVGRN